MSSASSSPKTTLDRTCINMVKADSQPCNVTEDNQGPDCYESMHAFKKIRTSTSGLRKSPNKWTKEENQKLASLVASYGEKKWKRISAEMGGQKTGAQCAQHWKRVLSPEIRKGHWDENEEDLLLRLVVQYGSCWKKIAKKIPQRTDIQCRYQYLKAKQSREVMWDGKEDESLTKKVMEMANCNFFQVLSDGASPSSSSTATSSVPRTAPLSSPSNSSGSGSGSGSGSDSGSLSSSPAAATSPSLSIKDVNSPMSIKEINSPMSDSPVVAGPRFSDSSSSLRSSGNFSASGSPMLSSPSIGRSTRSNKDTDDSNLSSSSGSEGEEFTSMKMSGEMSRNAWNDDRHNVNMTESTTDSLASAWRKFSGSKEASPLGESICANCHSPFISHINKVVWLEISEHMARLKLTSTLRTALECKTRFTELLGNKISLSAPNQFSNMAESIKSTGLKNSGDVGRSGFANPLRGSGGMGIGNTDGSKSTFDNIGVKINNNNNNNNNNKISTSSSTTPGYNGNNINLTNCNNNNITINITNSYTTNNTLQNGVNFQQLTHSASTPNSSGPMKSEQTLMGPSHLLSKNPVSSILSPAPPFPSFTHLSHPSHPTSFPQLPPVHQLKVPSGIGSNARNVHNGLESLAAVASILPREMLADYF